MKWQVGDRVRWAIDRVGLEPMTVTNVGTDGMVAVTGHAGLFGPHLFDVAFRRAGDFFVGGQAPTPDVARAEQAAVDLMSLMGERHPEILSRRSETVAIDMLRFAAACLDRFARAEIARVR